MDAYPLRTARPHRFLAWPRWGDPGELDTLLRTFARPLADQPTATLVLRHDARRDGPLADGLRLLQERYALAFPVGEDLDLLVLDDPLGEDDLPRLGAAVAGLLVLPSTRRDPERIVFAEALEAVLLHRVSELTALLPGATDTPVRAPRRASCWELWTERDLPGRLSRVSAAVWDATMRHQEDLELRGAFVELGVARGRSALLGALHLEPDEACVLVDNPVHPSVQRLVSEVHPDQDAFLSMPVAALQRSQVVGALLDGVRWLHLDAQRTGPATARDLALADRLLAPHGVAVLHEFFSFSHPQVTWAALRTLERTPGIVPFLAGDRRLYLCRPARHRAWLRWVHDELLGALERRLPRERLTLYKTALAANLGCFGLTVGSEAAGGLVLEPQPTADGGRLTADGWLEEICRRGPGEPSASCPET